MANLKTLIKEFAVKEKHRDRFELGPSVRLDPNTSMIKLEATNGEYPLTNDLYFKTWVANPDCVREWGIFEAVFNSYKIEAETKTTLGFRVSDDINEYWWDGGAWVINTTTWNTEAEVSDNLITFPATEKKIQIIVNLKTTDKTVTPEVKAIKLSYNGQIEFTEDIIYRSLIPAFKAGVRPISNFPITMTQDSLTIDLANDYVLKAPYNVVGIDSVYNHTTDSDHFNDLFSSYDANAQVITLTTIIPEDDVAYIRFIYEPEVTVATSADYDELSKVPVIILEDYRIINANRIIANESVANKNSNIGIKMGPPLRATFEITLRSITNKMIDKVRLDDKLNSFFGNNNVLRSKGLDEEYQLWLLNEGDLNLRPNLSSLRESVMVFRIVNVMFWDQADDKNLVMSFNLTGDFNIQI